MMRFAALIVLVVCSLASVSAVACEGGYCVTSTVPADEATGVPLDARIYVYYNTTPGLGEPEGGMALVESDTQQGLLSSTTVLPGNNPTVEVRNQVAVLEPLLPLAPETTYEVVFGPGTVCSAPSLTFTTGTELATAPTFAGATAATAACVTRPDEITSCNDQDIFPRLRFEMAAAATDAAGYAVYRDDMLVSLIPEVPARTELLLDEAQAEECFEVRAVGINGEEAAGPEVCAQTTGVCPEDTPDMGVGPSDMGSASPDMGTMEDTGSPNSDAGTEPSSDMSSGSDLGGNSPLGDTSDAGCGCASGRGGDSSLLLSTLAAAAIAGRRRRQ